MNPHELGGRRAARARLSMLESLARSQAAVARMLECAADAAGNARLPAGLIRQELRALARVQSAMLAAVTGLPPRRVRRGGTPAPPWLGPGVGTGTTGAGNR
jgi:hypothetical protein